MSGVGDGESGGQASKSAAISALVQQLRDGAISRTELFTHLTRLHRGEAAPAAIHAAVDAAQGPHDDGEPEDSSIPPEDAAQAP